MGSVHRHIPFYIFLILVLSSNEIPAAKAHKKPITHKSQKKPITHKPLQSKILPNCSLEPVLERKAADAFKSIVQLAHKNGIANGDFNGLAKIALQNAITTGTTIYHRINSLSTKYSDTYTKRCLTGCSTKYQNAIDLIKKSLAALDSKNCSNVNAWVRGAIHSSSTCEDGFQQTFHTKSPISSYMANFNRLCLSGLKLFNSSVEKERLLDEGCAQTSDKEVCKFIVEARLENKTITLQGLAKRAVEIALKDGAKILRQINVLLNTTADQKVLKRRLQLCSNFYQNAIGSMRDSLPALDAKHYSDASTWVGSAFDEAETCDDMFVEPSGGKSPLCDMSSKFKKPLIIALGLIKMLPKN